MVKKYFRKFERGQLSGSSNQFKTSAKKSNKKLDKQYAECEGIGHYKSDCPTIKRRSSLRCYECNGFGHTKTYCLAYGSKKERSYVTLSESDTNEDDKWKGEILNNFVAYLGINEEEEEDEILAEQVEDNRGYDSEGKRSEFTVITALVGELTLTKEENVSLVIERKKLLSRIDVLEWEVECEKTKTMNLEQQLATQLKNIKMLSRGTKDLDTICQLVGPATHSEV